MIYDAHENGIFKINFLIVADMQLIIVHWPFIRQPE